MAPVVQVLFIDVIVLAVLPARGLYHADRPPGLCGQKFRTQLPVGGAAAPQPVQRRKTVKGILLRLKRFRKSRLVPVQHNKRAPCIIRKVFQRNEGWVLGRSRNGILLTECRAAGFFSQAIPDAGKCLGKTAGMKNAAAQIAHLLQIQQTAAGIPQPKKHRHTQGDGTKQDPFYIFRATLLSVCAHRVSHPKEPLIRSSARSGKTVQNHVISVP